MTIYYIITYKLHFFLQPVRFFEKVKLINYLNPVFRFIHKILFIAPSPRKILLDTPLLTDIVGTYLHDIVEYIFNNISIFGKVCRIPIHRPILIGYYFY